MFLVHFYFPNDGKSYNFAQEMMPMAEKLKGIVVVGSVDCKQNPQICQKELKSQEPSIIIYLPMPYPSETFPLQPEGSKNPYEKQIK